MMTRLIVRLRKIESPAYSILCWVDFSKVKAISECINTDDHFYIYFDDGTTWTVKSDDLGYGEILTKWQKLYSV